MKKCVAVVLLVRLPIIVFFMLPVHQEIPRVVTLHMHVLYFSVFLKHNGLPEMFSKALR